MSTDVGWSALLTVLVFSGVVRIAVCGSFTPCQLVRPPHGGRSKQGNKMRGVGGTEACAVTISTIKL